MYIKKGVFFPCKIMKSSVLGRSRLGILTKERATSETLSGFENILTY